MSYRFMRIIVFFDLPSVTNEDKREYRKFRKILINKGFIMMQESVYCRMSLNQNTASSIIEYLHKNKPRSGLVQILNVTEKQFAKMVFITGEHASDIIDSDERVIFI